MDRPPSRPNHDSTSRTSRATGAVVLAGVLALFATSIASGNWDGGRAPFPYVWRDVAVVHFACALPLAIVLGVGIRRRVGSAGGSAVAWLCLGVGILPLFPSFRPGIADALLASPPLGLFLRSGVALALTTCIVLATFEWRASPHERPRGVTRRDAVTVGAVGAVAMLVLPWTYIAARTRHDLGRVGEFLSQSRYGEAGALIQSVLLLDPRARWENRPLSQVAAEVDRTVRELKSRVAVSLAGTAGGAAQLERARQLAMLGRTADAVEVLDSIRDPSVAPDAYSLHGTICESAGEWETGLDSYRRAAAAWESRAASAERAEGLARATTGIAYCQRKLGRYADAEGTYLRLLALAPTADNHFLLARFYEDAQQADKAHAHARRAIELAPSRYHQQGKKLIDKLAVYHFGCLGVVSAEFGQSGTP